MTTFVVVGAGVAGGTAAAKLREEGFDGNVVLIGAEDVAPYERPPLSKEYLRGETSEPLYIRDPSFYEENTIDARFGVRAEHVNVTDRVVELEGGERVARLFSAGAPFQGSVKVFQTVEKGWGPLNAAMGGLDGFRRTMLSWPSVFELMPRYNECCDGGSGTAFDPGLANTWKDLHWDGVDTTTMPDLQKTFVRVHKLKALVA